jgi:N-methylhydantoinase A
MSNRIGVDVGGTFTDLVFLDETTGEMRVAKELSTPDAPERAVSRVIDSTLSRNELAQTRYFLHGTTVGLNALLERRGATIALLTTAGFRDVLEKRRSNYLEVFNPCWHPPLPLVPRYLRFPIRERIGANGLVVRQLEDGDVRAAAERLGEEGVESVAVAFINAYAAPDHELKVEELLRDAGFEGHIVLSHRISGEYREFERTATTAVDAYIRPQVAGYLDRLEHELVTRGCTAQLLLTRSGGGALTFEEARLRPFETILSGPVGGTMGAARIAQNRKIASAITADVGGTSFDTSLITNGEPSLLFQGEVVDLPIQTSWIDVRSIGAGGGSITWVDEGGLPRVGPRSAGAKPGPAAYGHGGELPTVTDAAVVLGLFGAATLAGGLALDPLAATRAFVPVAEQLGLTVEEVARGTLVIASTQMAGAIKSITVERGVDPRDGSLILFGGAGGLFASLLARDLGVKRVLVPPFAGNFSATGLLRADVVRSNARTRLTELTEAAMGEASTLLGQLFGGIRAAPGASSHDSGVEDVAFDLRYRGQEHTITVPAAWDGSTVVTPHDELGCLFGERYRQTFGHQMNEAVELVTVRATLRESLPAAAAAGQRRSFAEVRVAEEVEAYSFSRESWASFNVVSRDSLPVGEKLAGPLIVLEPTATVCVDAGFVASIAEDGLLNIERNNESRDGAW